MQLGGAFTGAWRQCFGTQSVTIAVDIADEQIEPALLERPRMSDADLEEIRGIAFFSGLSQVSLGLLRQTATLENVPGKTLLFDAGGLSESLFVLTDGLVQLLDSVSGDEATILLLQPVTSFVTAAVLRNEKLLTAARTVKPSRIVRIPTATAQRLFAEDAAFARAITEDVCLNYRKAIRELKNMRMRTGFQRLVAWILAMQACSATPNQVSLPFNKALLAGRLGMSPETLSRDLARLAAMGVRVHGRTLHIADIGKLRQFIRCDDISDPSIP